MASGRLKNGKRHYTAAPHRLHLKAIVIPSRGKIRAEKTRLLHRKYRQGSGLAALSALPGIFPLQTVLCG
ncbi:hypothetical protein [Neisseria chenwenguii]|uniref:hypothetical protein n=1 Tax=Neisseria chenwenguii TaxID=1853278 RepID=UPI000F50B616|nr:hypothetical protein [Neisseria chenwenguii]